MMEICIERGEDDSRGGVIHVADCPGLTDPERLGPASSQRSLAVAAVLSGHVGGPVIIGQCCQQLPPLSGLESFEQEVHMRSAEATANALRFLIPLIEVHQQHPDLAGILDTSSASTMADALNVLQRIVAETVYYPVEAAPAWLCRGGS
jgi:hypothetical protein